MNAQSLAAQMLTLHEAMAIASIAVGLVFAYAALSKLFDMPGFVTGIRGYDVMPVRFAPVVAGLLVLGEGLIAVAHLAGIALQIVAPGAFALLSIFVIAMARLLRNGEKRPCLCFGTSRDDLVDAYSLIRLALLMAVEGILFSYLWINENSMSVRMGDDVYGSMVSVGVAAFAVVLTGWCLALPKFYRVWYVLRS